MTRPLLPTPSMFGGRGVRHLVSGTNVSPGGARQQTERGLGDTLLSGQTLSQPSSRGRFEIYIIREALKKCGVVEGQDWVIFHTLKNK